MVGPANSNRRGTVLYLKESGPKDPGTEIGREHFSLTVSEDGGRTLRAHCEMDDDRVLRDVTMSVDREFRPLDAYVRVEQNDAWVGSAWFRFGDGFAECQGQTRADGRISQKLEFAGRANSFAPHPVLCDGWQAARYSSFDNAATQPISNGFSSSPLANGASGPMLARLQNRIEFVGATSLDVPAGRFATLCFKIHPTNFDVPLEIWVLPEEFTLVRLRWAHLGARYDLAELR